MVSIARQFTMQLLNVSSKLCINSILSILRPSIASRNHIMAMYRMRHLNRSQLGYHQPPMCLLKEGVGQALHSRLLFQNRADSHRHGNMGINSIIPSNNHHLRLTWKDQDEATTATTGMGNKRY